VSAPAPRRLGALLAAAALVTACTGGGSEQQGTDADGAAPADVDAATEPDEIDAAYTQAVLDELLPRIDRAEQAALAEAPTDELPEESRRLFQAVHAPAVADPLLTSLEVSVSSEGSAETLAAEVEQHGATRWEVTELGEPSEECVPFRFDYVHAGETSGQRGIGSLVRPDGDHDPAGHNPTPWVIGLNGVEGQLDESLDTICGTSEDNDAELEG
jgi:hypothetical protein